ncbi:MAG: hypothetical protein KAX99_06275 [Azonexus sp.]|mgnify:CR=1 FL=1|jgi:hypothetical protein|nr:hypothetical protein [Rhodoferax sp.]MBP8169255.1 hypothetical protein [Azonexus sp.]
MNFWNFFTDLLDGEPDTSRPDPPNEISVNPANGLPMLEGTGIDIEGNPFGTDSHSFDLDTAGTGFDDCNNLSYFD